MPEEGEGEGPTTPEEVEMDTGLPIDLKGHTEIYGSIDAAIGVMKQRCEAGHDWVCAAYIDTVEEYIKLMVPMYSEAARYPTMAMLYDVEMEVAEWLDDVRDELGEEYGWEGYETKEGEVAYRLKGVRPAKQDVIFKRKIQEVIDKFENLMLERLGQERYMSIQDIRGQVRQVAKVEGGVPTASKKEKELKKEKKKGEVKEEIEDIEQEIERLKRAKEQLKKEMGKK